jgi:hypothetical protein
MPRRSALDSEMGCALGPGFARVLLAKGRTKGIAQTSMTLKRRGIASPHIRRRSRNATPLSDFSGKASSTFRLLFSTNKLKLEL